MPLELGRVTLPHPAFCSPDKFLFLPPPLWYCALVILELSFLFLPSEVAPHMPFLSPLENG